MEVQIHSDIHLDIMKDIYYIKPKYSVLILVGDISTIEDSKLFDFFNYVNKNWEKIFVVLGNHEYYSNEKISFYKLNAFYKSFLKLFNNVELLDKTVTYYKNRKIIGCTLWSPGHKNNTEASCFKYMYNNNGNNITYNTMNKQYRQNKKWLLKNIEDETIVITHYPVFTEGCSHPKYDDDPIEKINYICSNLIEEIPKKNCVFISGHTHFNFDFWENSHRFISNQKGYTHETDNDYNILGLYNL